MLSLFWPVLNCLFTFLDTPISSRDVSVEVFEDTMSSDHEGPYLQLCKLIISITI